MIKKLNKTNGENNMKKVTVNKTTYIIEKIESMISENFDYMVYKLRNKNTEKTLIHNTSWNTWNMMGTRHGHMTHTTPWKVEFNFNN